MSNFQLKPKNFSIFPNDRKKQPKQPDYTGDANVVCPRCQQPTIFKLAGWLKSKRDNSGQFIAGEIDVPREKPNDSPPAIAPALPGAGKKDDFDDDLPF